MLIAAGVFLALVGSVWYVGHCAWRPYADCRKCNGNPRFTSASGRSWRLCRKCGGSGSRIRLGRLVWLKIKDLKKAAID